MNFTRSQTQFTISSNNKTVPHPGWLCDCCKLLLADSSAVHTFGMHTFGMSCPILPVLICFQFTSQFLGPNRTPILIADESRGKAGRHGVFVTHTNTPYLLYWPCLQETIPVFCQPRTSMLKSLCKNRHSHVTKQLFSPIS